MFVNIFDVPENGGALAVVPGSHKLPFNPWEVFGKSFKSSLTLDADLHPTEMPNYVQLAAPGELPPFCLHAFFVASAASFFLLNSRVVVH
jgi:hypothetical protein